MKPRVATDTTTETRPSDIRSVRPYVLSRSPLRALVRRLASITALVTLDLTGLTLGLFAALTLREAVKGGWPPLWGLLWDAVSAWLPFLILIMLLVFWRGGLYAEREFRAGLGRIVSSLLIVAVLALAFGLGTGHHFSTFGVFPAALLFSTVLIGTLRGSYDVVTRDLLKITGARRRALLVGEGENLLHLRRALGEARGGIDYEFIGALTSSPEGGGLPVLGTLASLQQVLGNGRHVDELIIADSDFSDEQVDEIVEQAHRSGVKVRIAPKTTELLTQRAEYVPGQGMPLFELRPPVFVGTDWALKRAFDIAVSSLVVMAGLPIWLVIAAAIKLDSRGPVFYRDRRVGLKEIPFGMIKFRTMDADAAERQPQLEARNEAAGALFKIRDDPRVTRVGALLRRLSLDELPQVLNVLSGEMSLVGPRPLPVRDYEKLEEWHRKRYLVLPGMTGLWQISGRAELSFDDLVRLDFYYLENWSVWLDISILAKTIPAVLAARGAY